MPRRIRLLILFVEWCRAKGFIQPLARHFSMAVDMQRWMNDSFLIDDAESDGKSLLFNTFYEFVTKIEPKLHVAERITSTDTSFTQFLKVNGLIHRLNRPM